MARFESAYRQVGALSLGVAVALLAACGGGGGGGEGGGTTTAPVITNQSGPVTVTLPAYGGYAYWMAYQDGDGPWKLAARSVDGFSFQVNDKAGKYAVMLVQEANSPSTAELPPTVLAYHLTRAESASIDLRPLPDDGRMEYTTVQFTQQGAPASGTCTVALGSQASTSSSCDALASKRLSVPMERMDTFAVHLNDSGAADALVIQRDLDMRFITALNFDFTKAVALPAPSQTSALTGYVPIAGETLSHMASLVSRSGRIRLALGSQTTLAYPLVPAGALRSDDTYVVSATARMVQGTVTARRSASYQSAAGAAQTLTLPPYAGPLTLGVTANGSAARPTMSWTPVTGSTRTNIYGWDLSGPGPTIDFSFSAGWIGGARTVNYTAPDLTGLGWKPSWNLNRQTQMTVYYGESFTSRPTPAYFVGLPAEKVEDQTSWFTQMNSNVSIP